MRIRLLSKQQIYIKPVGTGVPTVQCRNGTKRTAVYDLNYRLEAYRLPFAYPDSRQLVAGTPVPTIRKDDGQRCGGDPYDLGSSGRRPLPVRWEFFVLAIDGSGFCDQNDLGRPVVAPTIDKDRIRMHSGAPFYTLLIHRKRSPFPHKGRLL